MYRYATTRQQSGRAAKSKRTLEGGTELLKWPEPLRQPNQPEGESRAEVGRSYRGTYIEMCALLFAGRRYGLHFAWGDIMSPHTF